MKISYNPITYNTRFSEVEFESNGQCLQIINENNNEIRISNWFTSFLEKHIEDFNESEFEFIFESTNEEVVLINDVVQNYNVINSTSIKLVPSIKEINNGNEVLKSLLDATNSFINDTSDDNFTKLEKEEIKENIGYINREVPVVIMAPMSAGKSTLINAILGQELLPSENQACTATICRIKDIDDKEGFDAIVKDENGNTIEKKNNIDLSYLEEINKKGNNKQIEITLEGDIKGVSSDSMNLLLIDTPGPNNSQNDKHKEVTYSYLKDNTKNALIIYVLNATQLRTNDDKSILQEISQVIKSNKSIDDRILFVLNRIDDLGEKESLDSVIKNCEIYLKEDFQINNPKIFPLSAMYAMLSSIESTKGKLTRRQNSKLRDLRDNILPEIEYDHQGMVTISHTPISEKDKNILISNAEKNDFEKDMLYSGLTALKFYINDYINKTHKIIASHHVEETIHPILKKKLSDREKELSILKEEIALIDISINNDSLFVTSKGKGLLKEKSNIEKDIKELRNNLKLNKKKKDNYLKNIKSLETKFNSLKPELKKQIDFLPSTDNIKLRLENQIRKEFNTISRVLSKDVSLFIAKMEIIKAESIISNLNISLSTTIQAEFNQIIITTGKKIEGLIKNRFSDLLKNHNFTPKFQENLNIQVALDLSNFEVKTGYKKETKRVSRTIMVKDSSWYNPFSWGRKKSVTIYENKTIRKSYKFVNLAEIFNKDFLPIMHQALDMLREAINNVEAELDKVKQNSSVFFNTINTTIVELRTEVESSIEVIKLNEDLIESEYNKKRTIEAVIELKKKKSNLDDNLSNQVLWISRVQKHLLRINNTIKLK